MTRCTTFGKDLAQIFACNFISRNMLHKAVIWQGKKCKQKNDRFLQDLRKKFFQSSAAMGSHGGSINLFMKLRNHELSFKSDFFSYLKFIFKYLIFLIARFDSIPKLSGVIVSDISYQTFVQHFQQKHSYHDHINKYLINFS